MAVHERRITPSANPPYGLRAEVALKARERIGFPQNHCPGFSPDDSVAGNIGTTERR
jgi:hypothetical protein